MSLLGRAVVSRRVYFTTSSSYNKPKVLSLVAETLPAATSARYFSAPVAASGGKSVSEQQHQRLSNETRKGTRAKTWSGWQVAAASFLAAAATGSLIAYPRAAAQNEPSVEATATGAPPLQRHSVGIVQRGQNRSSQLQYYATNDEDATTPFWEAMETSNLASTDGSGSYDISIRAVKGNRVTMEDEYFVGDGGRFAAVFDGHGGGGVSGWLRSKLYKLLHKHLKETHWEEQESDEDYRKPSLSAYVAALRKAFSQVEKDVLEQETLAYQGSTAVAVVLHESDDGHRTLISANVGDSRAILSRRGKAIDLTRDHKPNEEREKARILKMGEAIEWDSLSKVHRVRNLSLSRAIGDRYAKPVVSSQVEIKLFPVAEDGDEFFLLASDGLWDVMTSQDVVSYVHQRFEKELNREQVQSPEDKENLKLVLRRNMARSLAREALRRGTGDNVCVLMVWLQDLPQAKKE